MQENTRKTYTDPKTEKIIRQLRTFTQKEKDIIYNFLIDDINNNIRDKRLMRFCVNSLKDFRKWKKNAIITLAKSKKFTNELKKQARA